MGGCHGVAPAHHHPVTDAAIPGQSSPAGASRFCGDRHLAMHVMPIFAGEFLGRLRILALAILPGCQLRAKACEVLQRVVTKRRAQAEKGYRDQKAWHLG